jgi:hypothetical protein
MVDNVTELVHLQLRERVIQELELLRDRMATANLRPGKRKRSTAASADELPANRASTPIIARRLTMDEEAKLRAGESPVDNAVAYLEVPVNKFQLISPGQEQETDTESPLVPLVGQAGNERPSYNIRRLFEEDAHRLRVRKLFGEILLIERNSRLRDGMSQDRGRPVGQAVGQLAVQPVSGFDDQSVGEPSGKSVGHALGQSASPAGTASDIVVLSSHIRDKGGLRQGDLVVGLAIALWRLRCFIGEGWESFDADRSGRRV